MSEVKFSLSATESITLTGNEIDKLVRKGDGDAALLYLYIKKTSGECSDIEAARALKKSKGWVASALAALSQMGLISLKEESAPIKEPIRHTKADVITALREDKNFFTFINEVQARLGRPLEPNNETMKAYEIYAIGLPLEVYMQLITFCITKSMRKAKKMPTLDYILKVADTWARESLFTIEKVEEYLRVLEDREEVHEDIKQRLRIYKRELSGFEREYINKWLDMKMDPAAMELAYEKTVLKTGDLSCAYMDRIIENWHSKGLCTREQIEKREGNAGLNRGGASGKKSGKVKSSANEQTQASAEEMERMKRFIEELEKEE